MKNEISPKNPFLIFTEFSNRQKLIKNKSPAPLFGPGIENFKFIE